MPDSIAGMAQPMPEPGPIPPHGQRLARGSAVALLWTQAVLQVVTVPVLVLAFLFSLFEGGDLAAKHRFQAWAPVSGIGNLLCAVVLAGTAIAIRRHSESRGLLALACGLPLGLGLGWLWVLQGQLLSDPSGLGVWAAETLPAVLAVALLSIPRSLHRSVAGPP